MIKEKSLEEEVMNIFKSTGMIIQEEKKELRKSGKSTRLADKAVQTFFKEGKVSIKEMDEHPLADVYLFDKILKRIKAEHPTIIVEIDRENLTLRLKEFNERRNGNKN